MILLGILFIALVCLTMFITLAIGVGGAIFIIIFADVIVCILVLIWIIKRLIRR